MAMRMACRRHSAEASEACRNSRKHVKEIAMAYAAEGHEQKEYFGCDVFSLDTMSRHLPLDVYRELEQTVNNGSRLDPSIANTAEAVASLRVRLERN